MKLEENHLEVHWQSIPEHRLHKHSQRLDVDPGNKGFAEVDLEPLQQWAILLLLIQQQSGHLFPFPFNFFFIIVKFSYSELIFFGFGF